MKADKPTRIGIALILTVCAIFAFKGLAFIYGNALEMTYCEIAQNNHGSKFKKPFVVDSIFSNDNAATVELFGAKPPLPSTNIIFGAVMTETWMEIHPNNPKEFKPEATTIEITGWMPVVTPTNGGKWVISFKKLGEL